jgi:peptide/nickel transport system substrate-binding protein
MKKITKIISLLLCLCVLFSACTEKKEPEETTVPVEDVSDVETTTEKVNKMGDGKVVLPYNETDGLNPFLAKSYENLYLSKLMFEPLYSTDNSYTVSPVIAETINIIDNVATVRLRHGVSCPGSSEITAEDVVYSFNMAKASHGWSTTLKSIVSAEVVGQYAVDFILDYKDIYVAGKLDFPIVKVGTADKQISVPKGSGDYYYSKGKLINVLNKEKSIVLSPIGTNESAENAVNIGETDVYFNDLSDCEYSAVAGTTKDILLNNMVYLGLNRSRGALNNYIRNAIAAKLDSEKLVLSSYQGHATAMKLPVNPESDLAGQITKIKTEGDINLANDIIDRCGYTRYSGKAKTNGAYTLSLYLMVNKDNKFRVAAAYSIADSLNECGFLVKVQPVSYGEYKQRIESGNYDMYLGEVKLDNTMDISGFFREGNMLSSGINTNELVATEYFRYRAGEITAEEYYEIFIEYYPFIPVLFKKGFVATSDDVKLTLKQMPYNLYTGI